MVGEQYNVYSVNDLTRLNYVYKVHTADGNLQSPQGSINSIFNTLPIYRNENNKKIGSKYFLKLNKN